jgi:transcriptional regulator with XRE-family HTH domain
VNPAALAEIRELAGISQTELARRAGVTRAAISAIELSKSGVSPAMLRKLAEGLKCSIDAISHHVPDPEPEPATS